MSTRRSRFKEPSANLYFGDETNARHRRKDAQLCAQIADALSLALAESSDPALYGLWVMEVESAPHGGHVRVLLQAQRGDALDEVQAKVEARHGYLRQQVGEAIHRKKVPSLSFVVLPAHDASEEDEP